MLSINENSDFNAMIIRRCASNTLKAWDMSFDVNFVLVEKVKQALSRCGHFLPLSSSKTTIALQTILIPHPLISLPRLRLWL